MTTPADERARMRALAEKAANPELDHWQRTHALWELRAALSPPVVLGLLDAADRAEVAERECKKAERLWKESSIDASRKFDTIKGLGRAVEAERARAERPEAMLPLARYGLAILEMHREDCGDVSGDTLQDEAERCGLLTHVTVTEPCGDECRCAEYYAGDEWPVECLRYSPAARAAFAALTDPAPDAERGGDA